MISEAEANEIIKAQDQELQTKYHARKLFKRATDGECRICPQHDETTDHIMPVCPILVKEQYTKRHDESLCSTTL